MPDTLKADGSKGAEAYTNMDNPCVIVMLEYWETRGHYEKYLQWRTETGVMARFGSFLTGPPSIRYFERFH